MPQLCEPLGEAASLVIEHARLVAKGQSPHQHWEVWDCPAFGRFYRLDGRLMACERDQASCHQALILPAAQAHGALRRALVLGGGDGGSARQLLALPGMKEVVVAELDEAVVKLTQDYLPFICENAFEDPRLRLFLGDARDFVLELESSSRFDLIVFDLTDADGSASALHESAFLHACRARLAPGGIVSLHLASPLFAPRLLRTLCQRLESVFGHIELHYPLIPSYGGRWAMGWTRKA